MAPYNVGMRLGLQLREHRRQLGLTTTQVAQMIGVQQSAVSKWENGSSQPEDDKLDAIAEFLGVTRSEVVLMRDGSDMATPGWATQIEERLDRVEQRMEEMISLLHDLDRRIQGTSPSGGGAG